MTRASLTTLRVFGTGISLFFPSIIIDVEVVGSVSAGEETTQLKFEKGSLNHGFEDSLVQGGSP